MSTHSVRPPDDDPDDQLRPSPRREHIWRAVVITTWLIATGTACAWLTMATAGHGDVASWRQATIATAVTAIVVSCWCSIRRGQNELLAELRRTRPGYSDGYEAGHCDGSSQTYAKLRPWLPSDVATAAEGNVVRMPLNGQRKR